MDDLYFLSSHTDEFSLYHQFTTDMSTRWEVEDEGGVFDLLSVEISKEDDHTPASAPTSPSSWTRTHPTAPACRGTARSTPSRASSHPTNRTPADKELPKLLLSAVEPSAEDVDPSLL